MKVLQTTVTLFLWSREWAIFLSLNIFTDRTLILEGVLIEVANKPFFDTLGYIPDTVEARRILREIEHGEYDTPTSFHCRAEDKRILDKRYLSGGVKTLFNIMNFPNRCFSIQSCGNNVITQIMRLTEGFVYIPYPVVTIYEDFICDVLLNNKPYTDTDALNVALSEIAENPTDWGLNAIGADGKTVGEVMKQLGWL